MNIPNVDLNKNRRKKNRLELLDQLVGSRMQGIAPSDAGRQTFNNLNIERREPIVNVDAVGRGMEEAGASLKSFQEEKVKTPLDEGLNLAFKTLPGNSLMFGGKIMQLNDEEAVELAKTIGLQGAELANRVAQATKSPEGTGQLVLDTISWIKENAPGSTEELTEMLNNFTIGDVAGFGSLAVTPFIKKGLKQNLGKAKKELDVYKMHPTKAEKGAKVSAITDVNLRDMTPEEALRVSRTGAHLKRDKNGQYIGAPRGIDTPKKLQDLRASFDDLVAEGVEGKDWYERAQKSILEVTGGDKARSDLMSSTHALYSAQADPNVNLNFSLDQQAQYASGLKTKPPRMPDQEKSFYKGVDSEEGVPKLGPKTGIYEAQINPFTKQPTTAVNDIWHARAFGYLNPDGTPWDAGLSPQQHAFLDAETILAAERANTRMLGGKSDWNSETVQASPWVAAKGKDLHQRFPKRFPTVESGIKEASKTYLEHHKKYTVYGTSEQVPGVGTGHLEKPTGSGGMVSEVGEQGVIDYSSDSPSWSDPKTKQDIIYRAQGPGIAVRESAEATGHYVNPQGEIEINPAEVSRPMFSTTEQKGFGKTLRSQDQALLNAAESLRSYVDAQNMGAWHKPIPIGASGVKSGAATSFRIEGLDRALTKEEMRSLSEIVEPHGLDISDTGDGVTIFNFNESNLKEAKKILEDLEPKIGKLFGDKIEIGTERVGAVTGATMVDSDFNPLLRRELEGSGEATRSLQETLENPEIPAILDKLDGDESIRARVKAKYDQDAKFAEENNLPLREDIQLARKIISEQGLKSLFEALKNGAVLPATGLVMFQTLTGDSDER